MRRVGWAGLLLLGLVIGFQVMIFAAGNPVPQPTLDPLYVTAVAYVDNVTATAEKQNALNATATEAKNVALTAWGTNVASSATSLALGTVDPLFASATAIVRGATQTQAAILGITLPGETPVTRAPSPTATPIPTYTKDEFAARKTELVNILISVMGFKHPIFDQIANDFVAEESRNGAQKSRFKPEVAMTWFAGSKYVAALVPEPDSVVLGYVMGSSRFLLFRILNGKPVLLDHPTLQFLGGNITYFDVDFERDNVVGFADHNNNGLPDLAIYSTCGGSACSPVMTLIEIQNTGEMIDITPKTPDGYPMWFVDLNHDGIWEIQGREETCIVDCMAYSPRFFGWTGTEYVDITSQYPEYFMPDITAFLQRLQNNTECYLPVGENFDRVLLGYYAIGRLKEGWATIKPLLKWDACTAEQLKFYGHQIQNAETWVKDHGGE